MKKLYIAAGIGIGLSLFFAVMYFYFTKDINLPDKLPPYSLLILETFKTLLTFSLVTTGGVVLKTLIDKLVESDRTRQLENSRYEDTRKIILKEFTNIYSEFYSLRKLYHSAKSQDHIYEVNSDNYKILI